MGLAVHSSSHEPTGDVLIGNKEPWRCVWRRGEHHSGVGIRRTAPRPLGSDAGGVGEAEVVKTAPAELEG